MKWPTTRCDNGVTHCFCSDNKSLCRHHHHISVCFSTICSTRYITHLHVDITRYHSSTRLLSGRQQISAQNALTWSTLRLNTRYWKSYIMGMCCASNYYSLSTVVDLARFIVPPNTLEVISGRFVQVIWPNQQCQCIEGNPLVLQIRLESHQHHSTILQ